MNVIETIADRRIRQAREDGLFEGLAGAGKPIPDLRRQRPPGWWAARLVGEETARLRAEGLDDELRAVTTSLRRRGVSRRRR